MILSFFYVDDIILIGNSLEEINSVKETLDHHFKIEELGILNYFLGIKIEYLKNGG